MLIRPLERVWPDGDGAQLDETMAIIEELAAVDPDSHHLRYDRDADGHPRPIPQELQRVDLCQVRTVMHKLFGLLQGAVDGVGEMVADTVAL